MRIALSAVVSRPSRQIVSRSIRQWHRPDTRSHNDVRPPNSSVVVTHQGVSDTSYDTYQVLEMGNSHRFDFFADIYSIWTRATEQLRFW